MNNLFDFIRENLKSLDSDYGISIDGDDRILNVLEALNVIERSLDNKVLIITDAYEAGFSKGLQAAERGVDIGNPWGDEPGREAWNTGYELGKQRYKAS